MCWRWLRTGPILPLAVGARFRCRPPSRRPSRGRRGPPGAVPRREALRLRIGTAEPAIPPPPTFCGVLPLSFQIAAARALEAKTAPEGRFEVLDFPEEIWSGRRDSNPRPQPWQNWLFTDATFDPAVRYDIWGRRYQSICLADASLKNSMERIFDDKQQPIWCVTATEKR